MTEAVRRVVVVGGSAAGAGVVSGLRREGFDGSVTVLSGEPGVPYDRPPLSKQVLAGTWEAAATALHPDFAEWDVDWRSGTRAVGLDVAARTVAAQDGSKHGFDRLVIATGLQPRRPVALAPPGVSGVHVLRTLEDALRLRSELVEPTSVAVVGAGFIGSEVATTLIGLQHRVTLVDPLSYPLGGVIGPAIGAFLAGLHRRAGIDLRCGTGVAKVVHHAGQVSGLLLSDGNHVDARVVVLALGSTAATKWLYGSGLDVVDGVCCDDRLRAAPGISAAGDVVRLRHPAAKQGTDLAPRLEHRLNATEQSIHVARQIAHDQESPFESLPYFWSDQLDLRLQGYGRLRAADDTAVVDGSIEAGRFLVAHGRDGVVTGVLGVGMPKQTRIARLWVQDAVPWSDLAGSKDRARVAVGP